MLRKLLPLCVATLAVGAAAPVRAQTGAAIYAFLSAPNAQFAPTSVTGTTSETFTTGETFGGATLAPDTNFSSSSATDGTNHSGTYASATPGFGTYSGTFHIETDDSFGNGTGNYFTFGAQSHTSTEVTLTFAAPVTYFGLSYEAGDNNNGFTFFDANNNVIGRYSTTSLTSVLNGGSGTVKDLNNNTYNTIQYYGKPDPNSTSTTMARGTDGGEPFAFVNFFTAPGTTISKIVFDNSGQTISGFETDNHTISRTTVGPPTMGTMGTFVPIGSTGTAAVVAPDAGSLALATSSLPLFGLIALRLRKKA